MRPVSRLLVLGALIALCACPAAAAPASTTITLQNGSGYAGTTDTWLDPVAVLTNYGAAPELHLRWNNGHADCILIRFDLAGKIPAGAAVVSATLSLYYSAASGFAADDAVTVQPFRLQPGAWWDESAGLAQPGIGANWSYRNAGQSVSWTGGAQGGWLDRLDDGNGVALVRAAGGSVAGASPPGSWIALDVTGSVVQWKAGNENDGLLVAATALQGANASCLASFVSRDGPASYRPRLSITYETPVSAVTSAWGRIKAAYR